VSLLKDDLFTRGENILGPGTRRWLGNSPGEKHGTGVKIEIKKTKRSGLLIKLLREEQKWIRLFRNLRYVMRVRGRIQRQLEGNIGVGKGYTYYKGFDQIEGCPYFRGRVLGGFPTCDVEPHPGKGEERP